MVQAELKAMVEMGVIEESNSAWCSPIMLVGKKDGSIRFCVDYRKVNEVSRFDAYPMPRVDELLDRLGTARFFTTLDLTKGYWQIPLSPESKEENGLLHSVRFVPICHTSVRIVSVPQPRFNASWTECCGHMLHMLPPTWMM